MSVCDLLIYLSIKPTKKSAYSFQIALWFILWTLYLGAAQPLSAAPATQNANTCDLTIEIIAAPRAVVDSNKPGVQGPQVVMLGARITNQGVSTQERIQLAIGDGTTPGQFPSASTGKLALLNKESPTQWLPTLAAGQSETFYWAVTYPPTIDVSYPYLIWANTADSCRSSASSEITTQRNLSTNANKLLPTGSLVQVAPGAVAPGAIVTVKIIGFTLGTVGQGSKANYESWIQPVGNLDFDPTCLRFMQSKVMLYSVSATPFVDQFYFTGFQNYSRNANDYVEYTFVALRSCTTPLQPYQRASSGTQDKYNGDYGVRSARIMVATQKTVGVQMELTVDKAVANPGETVTFQTSFATNAGELGAPDSGSPAVITAVIPPNSVYRSGSATSSVVATLEYSTDNGQSWQSIEPDDLTSVSHLRWLLHSPVSITSEKVVYAVDIKGESTNCLTGTATIGILNSQVLLSDDVTVNCSLPTPTPTPIPTGTPDAGVGSGGEGGLESGPLPGEPSAFLGGIGIASGEANAAAGSAPSRHHKARLLNTMRIRLEDIIPTQGPAGTTPKAAVPVDVLAITNAPEAKAVDFVDSAGQIQAVALGILSLGGPYEHDYGVCNRFKEYSFDTIEPRQLALPNQQSAWFWYSHAVKGETINEEALFLHIFVDEANKQFHIDSRWIKDHYPSSFDFHFDYVFNLQLWSNDLPKTAELLTGILTKLGQYDNGAWQTVYHNQTMPTATTLFVTQSRYRTDEVELALHNRSTDTQLVRFYGSWRDHVDRNTLQPFEYTLAIPANESKINLIFPGLLDATIYVESNGFTDKIYQGGGLWFAVKGEQENAPTMSLGQCRQLDELDSTDLLLAGCVDLTTPALGPNDQVGIGRTLNPNGRSVDVSPYKALRFWAKGNGVPVQVILETAGVTNNDYFQTVFTPDGEWRQYMLPLAQFTQSASTAGILAGTDVKAVIWLNAETGGRALQLSIDQVSFTNQGLLTELVLPSATTTTSAQLLQVSGPSGIAQVAAHYSVDGGATFQTVTLNQEPQTEPESSHFQGELPGQPLGADVIYYLETTYTNGYVSRNPIDAPASYYRYWVDDRTGVLIDDFAGEALANRLTGSSGIFNNATVGGRLLAYQANHELILDYDVSTAAQFAGYFTNLPTVDARPYTTLDLLVRGAVGGEQVRIGLRNAQNVEKYISVGDLLPGGITSEWQWVQVPLRNFAPQMDLSALTSLSFFFAHDDGNRQGRFYVKELRLTSLGAPLVIDNFDDATLESNGQLMGYWSTAPNSTLNAALVAGDAQKATGKALQLQYTIGANGYAIWNSTLKQPTVQPESVLTFWVKGTPSTVPTNLYLSSVNGRARVGLQAYVTHNQWQRVEIPLTAFVAPGFDPNALTGFQVAFEFGQGSGELWLDQIEIGTPGAPQAAQRLLYLRDVDQAAVALHLPYGGAWQAQSDVPWLFTENKGAGAASINVRSVNWALAPGTYTGHVTIRAAGQTETIAAQLTVTQTGAPAQRLFLPLLAR